jgi:hypothetical protein
MLKKRAVAVRPLPSSATINTAFCEILPELQSRAATLAARCYDRQSAADDAINCMFLNFSSAARRGTWLRPAALGWAAQHYLRTRALATQAYPSRRSDRTVSINDQHAIRNAGMAARLASALTTSEREDPAHRAMVRLDWRTFAREQDRRTRQILLQLAAGEMKAKIAESLGISRGRLSQLLGRLAQEIVAFFGPEGLPELA